MKYILRATRYFTALMVSLHVQALRGNVKLSERKLNAATSATDTARVGLRFQQDLVRAARIGVNDAVQAEKAQRKTHADNCPAAEAECKYWGRDL